MSTSDNDHLVLIGGKSATGKSACLRNIRDPAGVYYLNCENNKRLPFKSKFTELKIVDPMQVYEAFVHAESQPNVHTIIIDSATFLMDMYETVHVITAADGRGAWGNYAQYWKRLMQEMVANSTKKVIITGHTCDEYNDKELVIETKVKVKGSLNNNGLESFFSTVIATKKMTLQALEPYSSDMLTISPQEEILGFKYVFQVLLTKQTVNERIRASLGMWEPNETFIDNDIQLVMDKLSTYYAP
jgi:hypothetical protein